MRKARRFSPRQHQACSHHCQAASHRLSAPFVLLVTIQLRYSMPLASCTRVSRQPCFAWTPTQKRPAGVFCGPRLLARRWLSCGRLGPLLRTGVKLKAASRGCSQKVRARVRVTWRSCSRHRSGLYGGHWHLCVLRSSRCTFATPAVRSTMCTKARCIPGPPRCAPMPMVAA